MTKKKVPHRCSPPPPFPQYFESATGGIRGCGGPMVPAFMIFTSMPALYLFFSSPLLCPTLYCSALSLFQFLVSIFLFPGSDLFPFATSRHWTQTYNGQVGIYLVSLQFLW